MNKVLFTWKLSHNSTNVVGEYKELATVKSHTPRTLASLGFLLTLISVPVHFLTF